MYACYELGEIEYFNGFCRHCISSPTGELLWDYFDYDLEELFLYNSPAYLYDAFDIDILDLVYKKSIERLIIDFSVTYNHREVIVTMNNQYVDNLYSDLYNNFYINDNLVYEENYLFNKYNQKYYDEIIIDTTDLTNLVTFEILSFSTNGYFKENNFQFDFQQMNSYDVDLNNGIKSVNVPYEIVDEKINYETFTFYKLIPSEIKYPISIIPLVLITYENKFDDFNEVEFDVIQDLSINLSGVVDDIELNLEIKNIADNVWVVYINDNTYFDLEQRETMQGKSNYFYTSKGLLLPFDYSNNYGDISFSIKISSYFDLLFNVSLPFKIINSYSNGINPKHKFIEKDNIEFETIFKDSFEFYIYEWGEDGI